MSESHFQLGGGGGESKCPLYFFIWGVCGVCVCVGGGGGKCPAETVPTTYVFLEK